MYTYRIRLWRHVWCILPVYELGRHGWLCTYHIWAIWVCRTWLLYTYRIRLWGDFFSYRVRAWRHGWLWTYPMRLIWFCRSWLIVYLSYMGTIMETFLILYFPCMRLKDMVDCALAIYEWYKFLDHGWLYTYRIWLRINFLIV